MFLPLDTGRMAAKFGKWRGLITVACAVGICIFAVLVGRLADFMLLMEETPIKASSAAFAAILIYGTGVLLGIWGACLFVMDAMRGSYIAAAARHRSKNH